MDPTNSDNNPQNNNDNEEQRLRDRVLQRRKDRQQAASSGDVTDPSTASEGKHPRTVSSTATRSEQTTAQQPKQQKDADSPSLPVSSSRSKSVEKNDHHGDEGQNQSASLGSGGQGESLASSGSPEGGAKYNDHSGKSRKRERRRQRRRMGRDDSGSSSGLSGGRYRCPPHPPGQYRQGQYRPHHPPPGQWERDRGGGGGGGERYSRSSGSSGGHRGPPPPRRYYEDDYPHRGGPPPHGNRRYSHRGRSPSPPERRRRKSRSLSSHSDDRSRSPSRSHSQDRKKEDGGKKETPRSSRDDSGGRGSRDRRSSGSGRRKRDRDDMSSSSHSSISSSSSSSSSSSDESMGGGRRDGDRSSKKEAESAFSKDQRTVFVTQLVMRTIEKDIRRYFKKKVGCKVNEVILLRDRRNRAHKGCAYVQFARIEDVAKAVGVSGQPPDFQRFPILVKASEAEKNYSVPASASVVTASMMGTQSTFTPLTDKDGKQVESQKVYVGGLDPSVSEEHLFAIFSQLGQLEKVSMQMDPATNASRGYAFLSFRDPKDSNLAIQSMAGQVLAGRPMKTGWANQASSIPGISIVASDEFPADGAARTQKALQVLGQLVGGSSEAAVNAQALSVTAEAAIDAAMGTANPSAADPSAAGTTPTSAATQNSSSVPTVAEARVSMQASVDAQTSAAAAAAVAAALTPAANNTKLIGGADSPTRHILVFNMFDKEDETDPGWEKEIKEEFTEEASKFGKIQKVTVMYQEPGGKIYASFEKEEEAKACAENLAGRWFDKRQLRVDFINDGDLPTASKSEES